MIRARALLGEVWRDLRSGTAHALLWASVLVVLAGGLAAADARAVVDVLREAQRFREAGAAIQVLTAEGGVDAGRCESLARVPGVTGAGALRAGPALRLAALPSTSLPSYQATPGLVGLLGLDPAGHGVALSRDAAFALGPSTRVPLADGTDGERLGVFDQPDDGRDRTLSYAAVEPVPATGGFDACWVEAWPPDPAVGHILRFALTDEASATASVGGAPPSVRQLNPTLGESHDTVAFFERRVTALAGAVAAGSGVALGALAMRLRRLELASARHAGVRGVTLTVQAGLESGAWAAAAVAIASPLVWVAASWGNPGAAVDVWLVGMRSIVAAAGAVVIGAMTGVSLTRERHLFRYFKER